MVVGGEAVVEVDSEVPVEDDEGEEGTEFDVAAVDTVVAAGVSMTDSKVVKSLFVPPLIIISCNERCGAVLLLSSSIIAVVMDVVYVIGNNGKGALLLLSSSLLMMADEKEVEGTSGEVM